MTTHSTHPITYDVHDTVEIFQDCRRACLDAVGHCSSRGGELAERGAIQLLQTCARLCRTSEAALSVGSGWCRDVLDACASACAKMALLCELHDADGAMQRCAESCVACAAVCDEVTKSINAQVARNGSATTAA